MLDLGATYVNAQNFYDSTGALVDPQTVTVTITLPDATTVNVTPTNPSVGEWAATYVPTQAGQHAIRWTGVTTSPASISWAFADAFDVLASYAVLAPSDLSTYLGVTFTDGGARATAILTRAQQLCETVVKPLPDGAQAVILDVAARAYSNPANAATQTTGPFGVGWGAVSGGLWLTRQNKATLRRLNGGGGAFTIDTMPADAGQNLPWWDTGVVPLGWTAQNDFV